VAVGEGVTVKVSVGRDGTATGLQALSEKKITNIQDLFIIISAGLPEIAQVLQTQA
jgi:hypothetical protein